MRVIMVMFDTLTRKFLPNYGCNWTQLHNFARLSNNCTRFANFYAGSLPCMPARSELHTGKYNFLHRDWGPLEPFDRSCMEVLGASGVYSHLCTDHSHYWEDGGATYHNRFSTWEGFRGQEGDRFVAHDVAADMPAQRHPLNKNGLSVQQHYRNRTRQAAEEDMSGVKTVAAGLEFLREHTDLDNWFLQIECFDPHEPFYVPQKYRSMYGLPEEETLNWPRYGMVPSGDYRQDIENAQKEYAALMTMCDGQLGRVLDFMDAHDMWKDTALIVNTDHGFLLGEHECLGKNFPPVYDELVHTPFFLHLPGQTEGRCTDKLACTVDIPLTLLDLFDADSSALGETDGTSLLPILTEDNAIHESVLFGLHGSFTCVTDGSVVYMKAPLKDAPFYEYTLMPTNIRGYFFESQLKAPELVAGMRFTNGLPCLRYPGVSYYKADAFGNHLYDLRSDPAQTHNLAERDQQLRSQWDGVLKKALQKAAAPEEEYARIGLC